MLDGQFRKWLRTVQNGEELKIDPGPPLYPAPTPRYWKRRTYRRSQTG